MDQERQTIAEPSTGVEMEGQERRITYCGSCGKQCLNEGLLILLDSLVRCHQCLEVPVTRKEEQLKN